MALFGPARPAGPLVRLVRRIVDSRFYLKAVIGLGLFGLLILPTLADLVNAAMKPVASAEGECRIIRVVDGDTVTLICPDEGMVSARLLGFDTPEKYAPKCLAEFIAAEQASWHLRALIQRAQRLKLGFEGRDQYGRVLARLDLDGQDVAGRMIRAGHARAYGGGLRGSWCG